MEGTKPNKKMKTPIFREIPYNYTSADDSQIVKLFLGTDIWNMLEQLRSQRVTGRSARRLMRFMGDMFILRRNPFIYQELIDSPFRRRSFLTSVKKDLDIIQKQTTHEEVLEIIARCRAYLADFEKEIGTARQKRRRIQKVLGKIVGEENVCFDPFSLISHATDATDWRLFLPLAVIRPSEESQVTPLLVAVEKLGLHVIPRGAGTGLTGGSVPVSPDCVIINAEKLNRIRGIHQRPFVLPDGRTQTASVLELEAGVITQEAMAYAAKEGLVFATDPTSSWACTIGGNIAENAGGKTAVLWGTAIDNVLSYTISMPGGNHWLVRRTDHRLRKILPDDTVTFEIRNEKGDLVRTVELHGSDIRKKGLGKDITNKALKGLPGIQKEGTDGIITSAEFIVYPAYEYKTTFCLEFFGDDMEEASQVIVKITDEFPNRGEEALMALEHFDDEYVKAINYKVKAARSESPKAVLLIDMVGHTPEQIERGRQRLKALLQPYKNTRIFVAKDETEAERFWRDRKRFGAIAARTNAFKLNEDIVLPLEKLAEFARFAENYNIEENRYNQQAFIRQVAKYLEHAVPIEDPEWLATKIPTARRLCDTALTAVTKATASQIDAESVIRTLKDDLLELFRGYDRVSSEIRRLYDETRSRLIIIATHMHAGDGNVHVNIPVFSNDREMMLRAAKTADDIMAEAVRLDGVVSGEHGIGITKMKYLDRKRIEALTAYRNTVDPNGVMNPGKLSDPEVPDKVFTPSFNLLGLEARILQHGSLEALAAKISHCVRCGKCKADCCVFYPDQNLFFHPRNKNLAIASMVEALLYDAQRLHAPRFKILRHLEEIADHCTLCHKCFSPCPVDIDTAEVSILEREILADRKFKHTAPATRMSLFYLQTQSRLFNAVFRQTVVKWGGNLQRYGVRLMNAVPDFMALKNRRSLQVLSSPMPPAAAATLRSILPTCNPDQALLLHPPEDAARTVFYFPGCGSERLFSDVAKAAIYILLKSGTRVVLPPPFLCCGFPAKANAKTTQHEQLTLKDTIIFSQIREMLRYLSFDACVISCGTCRETLIEMDSSKIFDCPVTDVSQFALENGLQVSAWNSPVIGPRATLYHAPCHDSLNGRATALLNQHAGYTLESVPHCCSEAGTLSLSRPDISSAMRLRKADAIHEAVRRKQKETILLTNCPGCLQGLGRNAALGIEPRHMAVELAIKTGGEKWEEELCNLLDKTELVTF